MMILDKHDWDMIKPHLNDGGNGSIAALENFALSKDFNLTAIGSRYASLHTDYYDNAVLWNITRLFQAMLDSSYPVEYCIEQLKTYLQSTHGVGMDSYAWAPPTQIFGDFE